jgi:hypothetical protein
VKRLVTQRSACQKIHLICHFVHCLDDSQSGNLKSNSTKNKQMKSIAVLLLSGTTLVLCCSMGSAQTTIYSQTFSGGATSINGIAPTTANTYAGGDSSKLWSYTGTSNLFLTADGHMDGNSGSALLNLTPQAGYLYTLTASVTLPADMNGQWIAMGFTLIDPTGEDGAHDRFADTTVRGSPWMLARTGGADAAHQADQFFSAVGGTTIDSEDLASGAGTYTLTLDLNTSAAQWTTTAYIDSTQMGSVFTYSSNPAIVAAGLGDSAIGAANAAGIQWNSWSLSAIPVPEPSIFALTGLGMGALLLTYRKQKQPTTV